MKIVLRADVDNLGNKGDLVDVRDGYARNYLVPRGLAIVAGRGVVKQAEAMRRNRAARDLRDREAAQAVAAQFAGRTLDIAVRAGDGGKLFGSVGAADVVDAMSRQFGVEIDRRNVAGVEEAWKELGDYEVSVKLHSDVVQSLTVKVVAQ